MKHSIWCVGLGAWGVVSWKGYFFFPIWSKGCSNGCFIKWRLKFTDGFIVTLLCLCNAYIFLPLSFSSLRTSFYRLHLKGPGHIPMLVESRQLSQPVLPRSPQSLLPQERVSVTAVFHWEKFDWCSVRVNMCPIIMVTAIICKQWLPYWHGCCNSGIILEM